MLDRGHRWLLVLLLASCAAGCSLALFKEDPARGTDDGGVDHGDADVGADADGDADADADAHDGEVAGTCGDGNLDDGEECDDGNLTNGDGCDSDCTWTCSSNVDCDDGEDCNGAEACNLDAHKCQSGPPLGDGTSCTLEDGGAGTCRSGLCTATDCGNGHIDSGEECDDGNTSNTDDCLSNCTSASCGDGFVHADVEECDDGNDVSGDGCDIDCTFSCGLDGDCSDGEPCDGTETCNGRTHVCHPGTPLATGDDCVNSAGNSGTCQGGVCMTARCGDGHVDSDEECDDGNHTSGDGCEDDCLFSCHFDSDCKEHPVDDVCTTDTCLPESAAGRKCKHSNNTEPCNDGDPCTESDQCAGDHCAGILLDRDHDSFGPGVCGGDCDDSDPSVHPGAAETCNNRDDDCDMSTDEELFCSYGAGLTTDNLYGVYGVNARDVWIVGARGVVLHWDGVTWVVKRAGAAGNSDLHGVWCSTAGVMWAVGDGGTILRYDTSGFTTIAVNTGTPNLAAVSGAPGATAPLAAVGVLPSPTVGAWYVARTTPPWTSDTLPAGTGALRGLWGVSSTDAWGVGAGGTLLHRTTGGLYNLMSTPGGARDVNSVWGVDTNNVYAVGAAGRIWQWNGTAWSWITSGTSADLVYVWGFAFNDVWIIPAGVGSLLHYDGTPWVTVSTGVASALFALWGADRSDMWLVGPGGGILRYRR